MRNPVITSHTFEYHTDVPTIAHVVCSNCECDVNIYFSHFSRPESKHIQTGGRICPPFLCTPPLCRFCMQYNHRINQIRHCAADKRFRARGCRNLGTLLLLWFLVIGSATFFSRRFHPVPFLVFITAVLTPAPIPLLTPLTVIWLWCLIRCYYCETSPYTRQKSSPLCHKRIFYQARYYFRYSL